MVLLGVLLPRIHTTGVGLHNQLPIWVDTSRLLASHNYNTQTAGRRGATLSATYSWLVKVLGQFSIIYFRGLGLRIGVRVWVRVRVGVRVWVRVRVRVRVRVSVVLWSG